jgi:uncharacterized membrane protein (UPF0127 family)
MSRFLAAALLVVLATLFAPGAFASGSPGGDTQPMMLPPDPVPLTVEGKTGVHEFTVEIADEPRERERGLMFREFLEPRRGMLFVFEQTQRQGFWMRNTPLPLDLIFVAENGRVVAIRAGEPYSESIIAPIYPVRFVLELNRGTAESLAIGIGSRLRHPVIEAISGRQ